MRRAIEFDVDRIPEWLQMVQCTATFRGPACDPALDFSLFAVVWFQDE
jgi:hypothetical protein